MLSIREYHRIAPVADRSRALDAVLSLLARPELRTAPLAGGTALLAGGAEVDAVVDLQGLGLDTVYIDPAEGIFHIGPMVSRARLADDATARRFASGVIADGARRWQGSVQRNRATVGGALALAEPADPLVAALLACDAAVMLARRDGVQLLALVEFVSQRQALLAVPALIVEVLVPGILAGCEGALETTARTPADAPIVAAAAVLQAQEGHCMQAGLALGGVAPAPLRLPGVESLLRGELMTSDLIERAAALAAESVSPEGDFRGSAEYRRALARVLSGRALRHAWDRCAKSGGRT